MNGNPETAPAAASRWRDLGLRTASAAVLAPIVVVLAWLGGLWFDALIALIMVLMAREWAALVFRRESGAQLAVHAVAGVAAVLLARALGPGAAAAGVAGCWVLSLVLARDGPGGRFWRIIGVPYIGASALALWLLRADPGFGLLAMLWLFAVVWGSDIGAYFAGRLLGGPKLAPRLSPKKTWAGLFGGMAGAAAAGIAVAAAGELPRLAPVLAISAASAVVGQIGDIFESAAKRCFGVKDSGTLIPGHGGILDRVDSLVAVAAAAALIGAGRLGGARAGEGILVW